jgi:hypothetical protein
VPCPQIGVCSWTAFVTAHGHFRIQYKWGGGSLFRGPRLLVMQDTAVDLGLGHQIPCLFLALSNSRSESCSEPTKTSSDSQSEFSGTERLGSII